MELRKQEDYYFSLNQELEKKLRIGSVVIFFLLGMGLLVYREPLWDLAHVEALYYLVVGTSWETLFRAVTFLGDDEGFMLIVAFVYWCVHKSIGFWTMVVLLVSGGVNFTLKEIIGLPRPSIPGVVPPENPSFPSGHTFSSFTVWGHLAARFRHRYLWIVSLLLIGAIGASRLFLGYHYIGDVLGGLLLGYLFLVAFFKLWSRLVFWLEQLTFIVKLSASLGGILVAILAVSFFPLLDDLVMILGFLTGGCLGYVLERETVGFIARGAFWKQLVKMVLGAAGLVPVMTLLVPAFSGSVPLAFLSFVLASFWAFFLAPLLFTVVGLSSRYRNLNSRG